MRGEVKLLWQSNHILVLNTKNFDEAVVEKRLSSEELKHAANLGV
jgi:hypothetical protein